MTRRKIVVTRNADGEPTGWQYETSWRARWRLYREARSARLRLWGRP